MVVGGLVVGGLVVGGLTVVGVPVVGATVEVNCQLQVPDSSPTAAMPNLFSLMSLALSSVAVPVMIPYLEVHIYEYTL